jgi:phage tail-like protein
MALGVRRDPYGAFNFLVELAGIIVAGFTEVSGLDAEVQVEEYHEGGQNAYIHRLPGPARYPTNLVLRHGLSDIDQLWRWQASVLRGSVERQNASVVLLGTDGEPVWRWNFRDAYPVRWSGPSLRASTGDVAIESLELVHNGLDLRTSGKVH